MKPPLAQAALCLILCTLLTAQQVSQPAAPQPPQPTAAQRYVTLPSGANIELLAPGPTRFAREKPGVVVQFVLDRDVALGGVP